MIRRARFYFYSNISLLFFWWIAPVDPFFSLVPLLLIESTDKLLRHIFQHTTKSIKDIYIFFLYTGEINIGRCLFVCLFHGTCPPSPLTNVVVYWSVCTQFLSAAQWNRKEEGDLVICFWNIHHTLFCCFGYTREMIFHL